MGSRIYHARALSIIADFKEFKTIPSVAARLIRMIEDDTSTLSAFESIIKLDPTLVLRLLKLVNSAYFGLRAKINNVSEAVAYVGMENLRNMIVLDAVKSFFSEKSKAPGFSRERLWLHCAAVSVCSQMISERIFAQNGEDAFLSGILHDVGIIIQDQMIPVQFCDFCQAFDAASFNLIEFEHMMMETDHPTISCLLVREWGINQAVCKAVKEHHMMSDAIEPDSISGILQLSEYLVSRLNYTVFPEQKVPMESSKLLMHIKKNITAYRAILDDFPIEMRKAMEIYSLGETVDA